MPRRSTSVKLIHARAEIPKWVVVHKNLNGAIHHTSFYDKPNAALAIGQLRAAGFAVSLFKISLTEANL